MKKSDIPAIVLGAVLIIALVVGIIVAESHWHYKSYCTYAVADPTGEQMLELLTERPEGVGFVDAREVGGGTVVITFMAGGGERESRESVEGFLGEVGVEYSYVEAGYSLR